MKGAGIDEGEVEGSGEGLMLVSELRDLECWQYLSRRSNAKLNDTRSFQVL